MGQQSYVARNWRSREFRSHTLHLGANRATRRSKEYQMQYGGKYTHANTPYHCDYQGNLIPGVK